MNKRWRIDEDVDHFNDGPGLGGALLTIALLLAALALWGWLFTP